MSDELLPSEQQQGQALTVTERATNLLKATKRETELKALAEAAMTITVITNKAGYEEANRQRITLKQARLSVTKDGKKVRDEIKALSEAISNEEERLIAIVSPEERRLHSLQETYDIEQEAERQRLIDKENARVQRIKDGIEALRKYPLDALNKSSATVRELIESCAAVTVDAETFAEHEALASMVKQDSLAALGTQLAAAIDRENEQERIRLERIELEQLREAKRKQDEETARREKAERDAQAERERQAEADRLEQQRVANLQAESDRLTQELEALRKSNADRIEREKQAERTRLASGAAITTCAAPSNTNPSPITTESVREHIASVVIEADEQTVVDTLERPSDEDIIAVVADHFDVSHATAFEWITSISTFQQHQ